MPYVKVRVSSHKYKSAEPLTYQADSTVKAGSLVRVPLKNDLVLGVVTGPDSKPAFATKPLQPLTGLPPLPKPLLQTAEWIAQYYATPLSAVMQSILPSSISERRLGEIEHVAVSAVATRANRPALTADQTKALETIIKPDTYLLHGDTGTGKTRVYLELVERTLQEGRSAIILTPEIGLTSQLSQNLQMDLPGRVVVLHSQLTAKERELAWLRLLSSQQPQVVVGPRSALFSPLANIGLIIIDEAHDGSYKQDQAPRYSALRVAAKLASLHQSILVLGSATPNVEDYYVAEQRRKPIIRMTQLAASDAAPAPIVTTVDLKDRSQFKGGGNLSKPLIAAIQAALDRGEQSLLYLNRRGTARLVVCENCGWQALCPHCDIPLVYHGDTHRLRCHTCGHHEPIKIACPDCQQPAIIFKQVGTKAIAEEVQRAFPDAKVARFDTDNAKSERLEANYDAVRCGDVDILVGTQTLSKGLDLPLLTTLGIVLADTSLNLPDFSAGERTYQEISQVLGRIGRGHRLEHPPLAIVQTYQPDNTILQSALQRDWQRFYQAELDSRRHFHFAPFRYLLQISCRRASPKAVEKAAVDFANQLAKLNLEITVDGPAPSFHEKVAGKYDWQLTLKATQRSELLKAVAAIPKTTGWSFDLDPINLL